MRRVLFLDVDGVLNNRESMMREGGGMFRMHPPCVARLKALVEDLDAKLVLSSTWRMAFGKGIWTAVDALYAHGWKTNRRHFLGHTPLSSKMVGAFTSADRRGAECERWIEENGEPGDVYVAVDDDSDFAGFRGTLVLTQHEPGLTDEKAAEIRAAFGAA